MKYTINYERKPGENNNFELNTYASFCMSYINQIKDRLGFESTEIEKDGKKFLSYSMDMVVIRSKIPHNKSFRRKKNHLIDKKAKITEPHTIKNKKNKEGVIDG